MAPVIFPQMIWVTDTVSTGSCWPILEQRIPKPSAISVIVRTEVLRSLFFLINLQSFSDWICKPCLKMQNKYKSKGI